MKTQSKVVGGLAILLAVAVTAPILAQEKTAEEKKQKKPKQKRSRETLDCLTPRRIK
jgi:hypothetical protein